MTEWCANYLNETVDGRDKWKSLSRLFMSLSEQMQEGISHRRMLLTMDISGIHYRGGWALFCGRNTEERGVRCVLRYSMKRREKKSEVMKRWEWREACWRRQRRRREGWWSECWVTQLDSNVSWGILSTLSIHLSVNLPRPPWRSLSSCWPPFTSVSSVARASC